MLKIKEVKENIISFFSYKDTHTINDKLSDKEKYLTKRKFECMGVKHVEEEKGIGILIDRNNNKFVCFLVKLRMQNGLNEKVDGTNISNMTMVEDMMIGKVKHVLLYKKTNDLEKNIKQCEKVLLLHEDKEVRGDIEERIAYLHELNKNGKEMHYILVERKNVKSVVDKLSIPYNLKVLNKEELKQFINDMHNVRY